MSRQSITLTKPNDEWLKIHVEEIQDYASKSELINDLIRTARRTEAINQKLEQAEKGGFVAQSADDILDEFKSELL